MAEPTLEQSEQVPFDDFYPQALDYLSDMQKELYAINDDFKKETMILDQRVRESALARRIQDLTNLFDNYKHSVERKDNSVKAVAVSVPAMLGLGALLTYVSGAGPPVVWISMVGVSVVLGVFGIDLYGEHRDTKKYKQELVKELGQDNFEEKLGKLGELYGNTSYRFRHL